MVALDVEIAVADRSIMFVAGKARCGDSRSRFGSSVGKREIQRDETGLLSVVLQTEQVAMCAEATLKS